ncbi:MAG: SCP2 sterol-binding domain-containing protein [Blastocatellia bacterium]|nr:SCP2 sterol-binding domain-containing protein [Blastocatellia bacterium]MCS7156641.1 SCP2 sterol-binding domain-containing protein [Blastocatellia bacterium]MCX7751617.1 SCP2 sterol-binding domain-containing protein [Blastocatellia bacterium]MDW8168717.1 SCP2 sterol-binding domain-containing protein [Acidobacteriota bacterium]MDW8256983.1 SCP2 sterol-binding domain-containing protein [Acidobacteriota bacterium]
MTIPFPSAEWAQALREAINASPAYREAAADWEAGPIGFVVRAGEEKTYLWLDLHRGECRAAELVSPAEGERAPFLISAEYEDWKQILRGQLDPVRAIWMGRLKVRGDLSLLLRYMQAARELLACAARVPTRFQDES